MKYILAIAMALLLVGCGYTAGSKTTNTNTTYGDDTTIISCDTNTTCTVTYPGEEPKDTNSTISGAIATDAYGQCPINYYQTAGVCVPVN